MTKHSSHHAVHLNLPHHKLKKLAHGHRVQLEHHELTHGKHHIMMHHLEHTKLLHSRKHGKGMRLGPLSHEEIHASGSLWDTIKTGFNKYVKPVLSGVGDAIAYANPELAPLREGVRSITGVGLTHHKKHHKKHHMHHAHSEHAHMHELEHDMHHIGLKSVRHAKVKKVPHAGSAEMKAKMAHVRSMKKGHHKAEKHAGGSFLLY